MNSSWHEKERLIQAVVAVRPQHPLQRTMVVSATETAIVKYSQIKIWLKTWSLLILLFIFITYIS